VLNNDVIAGAIPDFITQRSEKNVASGSRLGYNAPIILKNSSGHVVTAWKC